MTIHTTNRLFEVFEQLLDDRVGIIKLVEEVPKEAGDPNFFHFHAEACNTLAFSSQQNFAHAGGASTKRDVALSKAVGEAVERYCSAVYWKEAYPVYCFDSAPFHCIPPNAFALYSAEQYRSSGFKFVPFSQDTLVRWIPTQDMSSDEQVYVPASMVFLPYSFDEACGEKPIAQRISTGLACHQSFEDAAKSAICEVVERDAFTITWQARLTPPQILIETLSEHNRDLVGRFECTGYSVTIFNITMDVGIPSVLGVLRGKVSRRPAFVFAASSSLDPEEAVRKSLEELAHTGRMCQKLLVEKPPLNPGSQFENVVTQHDHVHLYCNHTNRPLVEFLFSSNRSTAFCEMPNLSTAEVHSDLRILTDRVRQAGYRVLLADLTSPDVVDLGLRIVRAMIPGFHPLFINHRYRALGGSRLWEVPQKLGYKGIVRDAGDNPAPHPYP